MELDIRTAEVLLDTDCTDFINANKVVRVITLSAVICASHVICPSGVIYCRCQLQAIGNNKYQRSVLTINYAR